MNKGFLAQQSEQANQKNRKLFSGLLIVYVAIIAVVGFAVRDSVDFSDYTTVKVLVSVAVLSAVMLVSVIFGLIRSGRAAADGSRSLVLLFPEVKRAVAERIDREIAEGKILVDEYVDAFPEGKKPHGERVILIPSYLLLINGMGAVTAVPREKIYWVCAQAGRTGSSFIVRLMIFNEKKTLYMEGADVGHLQAVADKLYQYIPNVFRDYDVDKISYDMDRLFDKNREEFIRICEEEKKRNGLSGGRNHV